MRREAVTLEVGRIDTEAGAVFRRGVDEASGRLVLRPEAGPDAIDELAFEAGWQLSNVLPEGPRRPEQRIYAVGGGTSYLYVVTDQRLGVRYVHAVGAEAKSSLDRVASAVPVHATDDALELLDPSCGDSCRRGLAILALGDREPGEEAMARLGEVAKSRDVGIRMALLTAIAYAPRLARDALVAEFEADPEPQVRRAAAEIREVCRP